MASTGTKHLGDRRKNLSSETDAHEKKKLAQGVIYKQKVRGIDITIQLNESIFGVRSQFSGHGDIWQPKL